MRINYIFKKNNYIATLYKKITFSRNWIIDYKSEGRKKENFPRF